MPGAATWPRRAGTWRPSSSCSIANWSCASWAAAVEHVPVGAALGRDAFPRVAVRIKSIAAKGRSYGHESPARVCYAFPSHDTRAPAMSRLRIFDENDPVTPEFASFDPDFIATELQKIGVTFERWKAS